MPGVAGGAPRAIPGAVASWNCGPATVAGVVRRGSGRRGGVRCDLGASVVASHKSRRCLPVGPGRRQSGADAGPLAIGGARHPDLVVDRAVGRGTVRHPCRGRSRDGSPGRRRGPGLLPGRRTAPARSLGALTAHAGWTLAAAQLVACVVLATVLRTARNAIDTVTQTLALVAALLGPDWARITAALRLLRTAPLSSVPDAPARPAAKPVVIPARPELVGRWTRRGAPTARCSIRAAG